MESREFATIMSAMADKLQSQKWQIESLLEKNEKLETELIEYKQAEQAAIGFGKDRVCG